MRLSARLLVGLLVVSLSACAPLFGPADTDAPPQGTQQETPAAYTGTVQAAGISIYQEGTHRLVLEDGRFILLESTAVNLNTYIGKRVRAEGKARATVEAGSTLLKVESVTELDAVSSSSESSSEESSDSSDASESSDSSSSESSESSSEESSASSVSTARSSSSRSSVAVSSSSSSEPASSSSVSSVSEPASSAAAGGSAASAMARQDVSAAAWTQQYCTSHIGFCTPVHKNWWYKSFGATTSYLWHVELSSQEIVDLGDGPLSINLLSGSQSALNGQVRADGANVIGYREWTDDKHFEIVAPAELRAAVEYITANISAYDPAP